MGAFNFQAPSVIGSIGLSFYYLFSVSAPVPSLYLHCHEIVHLLDPWIICNLSLDFIIFSQSQARFE